MDEQIKSYYAKKLAEVTRPSDHRILEILLANYGQTVTRAELVTTTGGEDRANRASISRLRNAGIAVVSDSREAGYRLAVGQAEVTRFVGDMQSRARKAFLAASKVKAAFAAHYQEVLA